MEMEGSSENLMVRLPRMAKIAERSRENDKVQCIQDIAYDQSQKNAWKQVSQLDDYKNGGKNNGLT